MRESTKTTGLCIIAVLIMLGARFCGALSVAHATESVAQENIDR